MFSKYTNEHTKIPKYGGKNIIHKKNTIIMQFQIKVRHANKAKMQRRLKNKFITFLHQFLLFICTNNMKNIQIILCYYNNNE